MLEGGDLSFLVVKFPLQTFYIIHFVNLLPLEILHFLAIILSNHRFIYRYSHLYIFRHIFSGNLHETNLPTPLNLHKLTFSFVHFTRNIGLLRKKGAFVLIDPANLHLHSLVIVRYEFFNFDQKHVLLHHLLLKVFFRHAEIRLSYQHQPILLFQSLLCSLLMSQQTVERCHESFV